MKSINLRDADRYYTSYSYHGENTKLFSKSLLKFIEASVVQRLLNMMLNRRKMEKNKTIVLVAHDNMKLAMTQWVKKHVIILSQHRLFGTASTANLIEHETSLKVQKFTSGPLGGDQQIGSKIVEGKIDILIFFWDPLTAMAHNDDVKALLRVAVLWNIPLACNPASAEYVISSQYIKDEYIYPVIDSTHYMSIRNLDTRDN